MAKIEIPEFDKKKYLRRELTSSRLIMLSSVVGVVLGLIAGLLQLGGLGAASIIFLIIALAYMLTRTPLKKEGATTKASAVFLVFMIYLSIWAVFANPPVMDSVPPRVDGVFYWNGTAWVPYSGSIQTNETKVKVKIIVVDNEKVKSVDVRGDLEDVKKNWVKDNLVEITGYIGKGGHNITITARDGAGYKTTKTLTINL